MSIEQIVIGLVTAAFAGGGAWAGARHKVESVQQEQAKMNERVDKIERVQGVLVNRTIRLITKHNDCCDDGIDTNRIES